MAQDYITIDGQQYAMGSTGATNALLASASKQTGIPAQTFTTPTMVADTLQAPPVPIQLPPVPPPQTYNIGTVPTIQNTTDPNKEMTDLFDKYLNSSTPPPNPMDNYDKLSAPLDAANQDVVAKQAAVKSAQGELGIINAQLQDITGQTQVSELKLPSEGIGQTGVNARSIALERDAAIRAIPLQTQALLANAKIASAQGDLESAERLQALAQDKMNTVFKIQTDYATQLYNYQKAQRDAVYNFATAQQKLKLDAQKEADDRKFTLLQNNLNQAQSWATTAINNGQGTLAAKIMALDPNSSDYQSQLAVLAGQISAKLPSTASIQEYEYAKKQGYTGTYQQYQIEDANRKLRASGGGSGGGGGGAGIPNLSITQKADFAEDIGVLSEQTNRASALALLNKNQTALTTKYGKYYYDLMVAEVDKLFPANASTAPAESTSSTPTATQQSSGNFLTNTLNAVGGFFSGVYNSLFGR